MDLPDLLPIVPFTHPVQGRVELPGSKSITNRALLLGALSDGPATLTGALFSEDTALMATALRALGLAVQEDAARQTIRVEGRGGEIPMREATLHVGLAGTAARFLTALCAAAPRGVYRIDGVPQMRRRPMKGLIDALRLLGADIRCPGQEGFFPLEIHAKGLSGGTVGLDATESSQLLSALLMVAPLAREPVTVRTIGSVREAFVQMTLRQMADFMAPADRQRLVHDTQSHFRVEPGPYRSPGTYAVEPDATAASYFVALPLATGGRIAIPGLHRPGRGLQGDTEFVTVMQEVGMQVSDLAGEPGLDVARAAKGPAGRGISRNFREFSDTFLTLAALSPLLQGATRIDGIAHTRKQETDRVAGMAGELKKLGQEVVEKQDSLEIRPRPAELKRLASREVIEIETHGDHRFAMSFGILGSHDLRGDGQPWLAIRNPACCAKTFPHFFELLDQLRRNSLAA